MGVLDMESPILGNFAPQKPEIRRIGAPRAAASIADRRQSPSDCALAVSGGRLSAILALGMCGYTAAPWRRTYLFVISSVCRVTDFSAEDKASGVKFCTAVYRHPG